MIVQKYWTMRVSGKDRPIPEPSTTFWKHKGTYEAWLMLKHIYLCRLKCLFNESLKWMAFLTLNDIFSKVGSEFVYTIIYYLDEICASKS